MAPLRIFSTAEEEFSSQWRALRDKLSLAGALLDDRKRLDQVRAILEQVRSGGDAAVAELTAKFDGVRLEPQEFPISGNALRAAYEQMDLDLLAALRQSIANVRHYQEPIAVKDLRSQTI